MPAKRKAAARGRKEAIDSEEESPKRKKACPPKPRAKKSGAYKMPPPLPRGEELTDLAKQSWKLEQSIGKGGFGEIYRAVPVGSTQGADYVIKIVSNILFLLLNRLEPSSNIQGHHQKLSFSSTITGGRGTKLMQKSIRSLSLCHLPFTYPRNCL